MGLPRTFIGFSSSDIRYYHMMLAWKAHEHIDFDFTDCQLAKELYSETESYIKQICRQRINMAGTFISLIGDDTKTKHKYVRWELEVAIEKGCRIIGVNLNGSRNLNTNTCPAILRDVGALFVSYNPKIIAYALTNYVKKDTGSYYYPDEVYAKLGIG